MTAKKRLGLVRSVGIAPNLPETQKTLERVVKKARAANKSEEEIKQIMINTRKWLRGDNPFDEGEE
jgi:hypothetical protein